jgi:hypothetical protein
MSDKTHDTFFDGSDADFSEAFSNISVSDALLEGLADASSNPLKEEVIENVEEGDSLQKPVKPEFSQEELLAIFDAIMFQGVYQEEMTVAEGRIYARYRTRTVDESNRINKALDKQQFATYITHGNHQALLTLSYAMLDYSIIDSHGDRKTREMSKDPQTAYKNLAGMPDVVLEALSRGLTAFDRKVRIAVYEAQETF